MTFNRWGIRNDQNTVRSREENSRHPHGGAATSEIGAGILHPDGEPQNTTDESKDFQENRGIVSRMNVAWNSGDHAGHESLWCVEKRTGSSLSEIKDIERLNVKTNHQAKPSTLDSGQGWRTAGAFS